jgi:hypothetical protein
LKQIDHWAALHREPNPVSHEPRRPVRSDAEIPLKLKSADSLLAAGRQVNCLDPLGER